MGCGFQRAVILLLKGDFWNCIKMYPPLLPTLTLLIGLVIHLVFKFKNGAFFLMCNFIIVILLMVINFTVKLFL